MYWEYDGTDFIVAYRNKEFTATDTKIVLDVSAYDLTKIHRFRLRFGYLGVGDIPLEIKPDNSSREWETLYVFKTDGALSERTHIGTPTLPIEIRQCKIDHLIPKVRGLLQIWTIRPFRLGR